MLCKFPPGRESGAALVRPECGGELNSEPPIDSAHPGVIEPGHAESDGTLRLQKLAKIVKDKPFDNLSDDSYLCTVCMYVCMQICV